MAASRGMRSRRRVDVDTEEKRAAKSAAEKFLFVSCAEVKEEPEGAVDRQVGTLKELPVPECEMCIKEETGKVGTLSQPSVPECEVRITEEESKVGSFEEISVPECDGHIKEEMDEATTPVLERDPLQIEEEEVYGATRKAPDSKQSMQNSNSGRSPPPASGLQQTAANDQLGIISVMSRGSASRGHQLKRHCWKPSAGTNNSRSTQNSSSGHSPPPATGVQQTVAHGQLGMNSGMSRGSASRGHQLKRHCQKPAVGTRDSRLMQNSNSGCSTPPAAGVQETAANGQLGINSVMSRGSASRGHRLKRHCQKPPVGTHDSRSGGSTFDDFICNSCKKSFPSKYELLTHVFIHIDAVGPPLHICRLCADVFPTQRCLQMHCFHTHLKNLCIVAKKGHRLLDTNKKQGNYHKHQSLQCLRETPEQRKGNVSPRTDDGSFHQEENCMPQPESRVSDSCQRSSSKDVTLPKRKNSRTGEGSDVFHRSNTSLVSPAHLKQHALDNSADLPYKCSDCGRYFKHQVHLQQHAVSHRKKLIICDECGRTFKRPVDLRQHTLSHTGEKPHVCKCGKSFAKSCSLKRHNMVHRGERPFRCDVCFKTFTDASVLKKHGLVHTGERAYVCGECGKAFKEAGHLRRHKLVHTGEKPHVCRFCGMSFAQTASLTRHTRVHTGEKPYKCPVCFKCFADRSNWRVHTVSHRRRKAHKCDICEKLFVKHSDLLKHVKVHIL